MAARAVGARCKGGVLTDALIAWPAVRAGMRTRLVVVVTVRRTVTVAEASIVSLVVVVVSSLISNPVLMAEVDPKR